MAVVIGYALLGVVLADLAHRGAAAARGPPACAARLALAMLALIVVVSLWTPMLDPIFHDRWFSFPACC